jgi:hypothetical protein
MDYTALAHRLADGDPQQQSAALVYALLAVAEQLEHIDGALRNTVGGVL